MNPDHDDHLDPWDRGLAADLDVMRDRRLGRRGVLTLFAGAGAAAMLAACGKGGSASGATSTTAGSATTSTAATTAATAGSDTTVAGATDCPTEIPEETAGPYPGDGSNGPDVLNSAEVVRQDITTSFGDYSGTAEGVPATVNLTLLKSDCTPMAGAALYLWHADKDGHYSMYTAPDANYLRGVQVADAKGSLSFTTIVPGCYDGRWPHMHFEIYASQDDALGGGSKLRTSQLAVPKTTCDEAYTAAGYESSVTNLTKTSLDRDMVFRDGWTTQLATVTGDVNSGFTMSLTVVV